MCLFRRCRQIAVTGLSLLFIIVLPGLSAAAEWIRPQDDSAPLVWGLQNGVLFGLPSEGGMRGPAGLIRVGITGESGEPELINFIAIEPVTKGDGPRHTRIAFSELEMSEVAPGKPGKRLWTKNVAGDMVTSGAAEILSVRIEVERFTANDAHVYVMARIDSTRPGEVQLAVHHHEDSAPIAELTLTATMGNYERLRLLWLKDRVIDSRELYKGYEGDDFVEKHSYPRSEMLTSGTDAIVFATSDEPDPSAVKVKAKPHWTYRSRKLTQYWRIPESDIQDNLRVRVNGRRVYWKSKNPIPGGISFENFELRQRYEPGQVFVFGLTEREPAELLPEIVE